MPPRLYTTETSPFCDFRQVSPFCFIYMEKRHVGAEMLNYIWAFMILLGILYGAFTGNMAAVTDAALSSAGEAVQLCLTMAGVMALWMGLMKIAETAGLIGRLTSGIQPFLSLIFPRIPKDHEARQYIAANFIANILGLGWACTPAGLRAMEALAKLEEERGTPGYTAESRRGRVASREMCTFLILNISSLQLIPVNMIVYRTRYGSANPAAVIAPAIIATLISTAAALIFCIVFDRPGEKGRKYL